MQGIGVVAGQPLTLTSRYDAHRPHTRVSQTLTRPGTYKLFCSLHPVLMTGVVTVRRR